MRLDATKLGVALLLTQTATACVATQTIPVRKETLPHVLDRAPRSQLVEAPTGEKVEIGDWFETRIHTTGSLRPIVLRPPIRVETRSGELVLREASAGLCAEPLRVSVSEITRAELRQQRTNLWIFLLAGGIVGGTAGLLVGNRMHAACDPSSGNSCPSGAAYHAVGGLVGFALGLPAGLIAAGLYPVDPVPP